MKEQAALSCVWFLVVCVVPEKTWTRIPLRPLAATHTHLTLDLDEPFQKKRIPECFADANAKKHKFVIVVTNMISICNGSKKKCRNVKATARKRFFQKIVTRIFRVKEIRLVVSLAFEFFPSIHRFLRWR